MHIMYKDVNMGALNTTDTYCLARFDKNQHNYHININNDCIKFFMKAAINLNAHENDAKRFFLRLCVFHVFARFL